MIFRPGSKQLSLTRCTALASFVVSVVLAFVRSEQPQLAQTFAVGVCLAILVRDRKSADE